MLITQESLSYLFQEDSLIGVVSHSSGALVELALISKPGSLYDPSQPDGSFVAEVGQHVIIRSNRLAFFGRVADIRLSQSELNRVSEESDLESLTATGQIELFATIDLEQGKVLAGLSGSANVTSKAYLAPPELVKAVAESHRLNSQSQEEVLLSFASLPQADQAPLDVTPEMMFGRHCAVIGTTGGGKSWTIARLVEECSRHNSKAILFDATGEYADLNNGVRHVHLGKSSTIPEHSKEVAVPYFELTEQDLFAMFKPRGQGQLNKLRAAIKSLKLAKLVPSLAPEGHILKADKSKVHYERGYRDYLTEIESPEADFDIYCLSMQIRNECVYPERSSLEWEYWGGVDAKELSVCVPLMNRIEDILSSPGMRPIFRPGNTDSLFFEIDRFLQDQDSRVICVSLKALPFAHNAREMIVNAIGRHLLHLGRQDHFVQNPLLLILDEAHQFLNKTIDDAGVYLPLDSFSMIAKEGRKFALNMCLATQRPRDIPEDVLSQMGTFIVHRLVNNLDREVVERACGEMDGSAVETVPTLQPGEAVMMGTAFPVPLQIRVKAPSCKPRSEGPNYQRFWRAVN